MHIAISKNSARMVNRGIAPDLTESFVFNALWPHTLLVSGFVLVLTGLGERD